MTWIAIASAFVASCCATVAFLAAHAAWRRAVDLQSKAAEIDSCKSQLVLLNERQLALEQLLHNMDQRDRMRKVRAGARAGDANGEPDPATDPVAWKNAMRAKYGIGAVAPRKDKPA
jgi:hypothetical protein